MRDSTATLDGIQTSASITLEGERMETSEISKAAIVLLFFPNVPAP